MRDKRHDRIKALFVLLYLYPFLVGFVVKNHLLKKIIVSFKGNFFIRKKVLFTVQKSFFYRNGKEKAVFLILYHCL